MTAPIIICTAAFMLAAYFVCGIPFGLVVAKGSPEHVDVRTVGSGNIGMTNVARAAGGKAAGKTFLLDMGKGLVIMAAARFGLGLASGGGWGAMSAAGPFAPCLSLVFMACIFGHIFSPYLGFHGGKGISVGLGAGLVLLWPMALSAFAIFLILAIPTRYISLGSIAAALTMPFLGLLFKMDPVASIFVFIPCIVALWRHRENVKRLATGKESRFSLHKDDSARKGR